MTEKLPDYHCPVCGTLSELAISPMQAFCKTDNCPVVAFNPSLPDKGMSDVNVIDFNWSQKPKEDE